LTALGYVRVSTAGQTLDQQRDALIEAGIQSERIYEDTISGVKSHRPGLEVLLNYARPGDSVTVLRLDRLGRSVLHMVNTIADLDARGITVRSLTEGIDLATPAGRLQAHLLMVIAQYEREISRERVAEARAAVERRGGKWGRKAVLTPGQVAMARTLRAAGQSPTDIAKQFGCSRTTLYRVTSGPP
jgi:DNA invertase Pin-like site-specific DNA recombinase